jgi:hypothetical protein
MGAYDRVYSYIITVSTLCKVPLASAHLPGQGPRWKLPGRAQHGQDTRRAAAGALDHGHRPRIRPAMLPQIHAGARSRYPLQPRSEGPGRARSSPEGAADPPGLAHVGSCQDVRSAPRAHRAQLPEPSIMGTAADTHTFITESEHPARGTRRATGARKAPDVLLYSLPRQNVTHTPELSRVVFCLLFAP